MTQFNLLPDVKQQYIKAARLRRTVIVVSLLVAASAVFIFVMLFLSVHVFQKVHMNNLNDDISSNTTILKSTKDLDKILTVQNQLKSLPGLHDQKPVTTRLFGYLSQITPAQISIGQLQVDFEASTMSITGTADSLQTVNKFTDTLKFTTYKDGSEADSQTIKPFSAVVLDNFSRTDKNATYEITLTFDEAIFDSSRSIALTVPKITSTRSETEKPSDLFKELPAPAGN